MARMEATASSASLKPHRNFGAEMFTVQSSSNGVLVPSSPQYCRTAEMCALCMSVVLDVLVNCCLLVIGVRRSGIHRGP